MIKRKYADKIKPLHSFCFGYMLVSSSFDVLNYASPQSVMQASFTSWGPTDDWRVKPDLTAVGEGSYSCLYPNPVNDLLNVDLDPSMTDDVYINLYSTPGQKQIALKSNAQSNPKIDVSKMPKGTYLLEVVDANKNVISVQKVMVQ